MAHDHHTTFSFLAPILPLLLLSFTFLTLGGVRASIGVNYGTVANNLPKPSEVAHFLLTSTIINRVRLYDADPEILQAFAHTGIVITLTIPNDQIPFLTNLTFAQKWLNSTVMPYFPATNIVRILIGNEVLSTGDKQLINNLVPAMQTLHTALVSESLNRQIQISTPHSLGILSSSSPPSSGKFRQGYETHVLKPLISFLKSTNSPFMVNPYPFFGTSVDTLDYALFRPNKGVFDEMSQRTYTNMFDAQLDAVFSAIKLLGYDDIEIVVAETGWPSKGDPGQVYLIPHQEIISGDYLKTFLFTQVGVDYGNAAEYNGNLMKHVMSGLGTPLMPNRTFETFIFALFNENMKTGPTSERNFGLFDPNMEPVYQIGILRKTAKSNFPANRPAPDRRQPTSDGKTWCLPKSDARDVDLQANIDYVCGLGLDCKPIQEGGACFLPNSVHAHAAYAMNVYFQTYGRNQISCDFKETGAITDIDPGYGRCKY